MRAIVIIGAFFVAGIFWVIWQDLVEPSGLSHLIGVGIAVGFFFWVWDWSKRFSGSKNSSDNLSEEATDKRIIKAADGSLDSSAPKKAKSKANSISRDALVAIFAGIPILLFLFWIYVSDGAHQGRPVPHSQNKSANWNSNDPVTVNALKHWAEVGNVPAQFSMGYRYAAGEGVIQDYSRAFCWYQHAAERGHETAMNNLGLRYWSGQGVEQDLIIAHKWFNLAAARGNGFAPENRSQVANQMDQEQIEHAQKLAREWESNVNPFRGVRYPPPPPPPPPPIQSGAPVPLPADDRERSYICD